MQNSERRKQHSEFSRPPWWALAVAAAVFVLSNPYRLFADGGTLRVSRRIQDRQVSVFTSPSVLRTGLVDISVLVQMAQTGSVCQDAVIRVELTSLDQPSTELTEKATAEAATNKLFKSAIFNLPYAGRWAREFLWILKNRRPNPRLSSIFRSLRHCRHGSFWLPGLGGRLP